MFFLIEFTRVEQSIPAEPQYFSSKLLQYKVFINDTDLTQFIKILFVLKVQHISAKKCISA